MQIEKILPAIKSNGIYDVSGDRFAELIGFAVMAGSSAMAVSHGRIFSNRRSALRYARRISSIYPFAELRRIAFNVELENGKWVAYGELAEGIALDVTGLCGYVAFGQDGFSDFVHATISPNRRSAERLAAKSGFADWLIRRIDVRLCNGQSAMRLRGK